MRSQVLIALLFFLLMGCVPVQAVETPIPPYGWGWCTMNCPAVRDSNITQYNDSINLDVKECTYVNGTCLVNLSVSEGAIIKFTIPYTASYKPPLYELSQDNPAWDWAINTPTYYYHYPVSNPPCIDGVTCDWQWSTEKEITFNESGTWVIEVAGVYYYDTFDDLIEFRTQNITWTVTVENPAPAPTPMRPAASSFTSGFITFAAWLTLIIISMAAGTVIHIIKNGWENINFKELMNAAATVGLITIILALSALVVEMIL